MYGQCKELKIHSGYFYIVVKNGYNKYDCSHYVMFPFRCLAGRKRRRMLKRINEGLPGLIAGILLYGVVIWLAGVWFVEDKWAYSIGLWYGIAIAIGMAINMAIVIYDVVTFDGEAHAGIAAKAMFRYVMVAILLGILSYFKLGDLVAAFIGVMGLKASAYLQLLLNKEVTL